MDGVSMSDRSFTACVKKKIVIAGIGEVGKAVALSIVNLGLCDELVLVNRTKSKAIGYALDLMHCLQFMPSNMRIHAGDFDDCADASIVILCPSGSLPQNIDRSLHIHTSRMVVRNFVRQIMAAGFNGSFIVITNPVDSITHFVWQISGLPKERIIGTGTMLDSARLRFYLGHILSVNPKSIEAFALGEHGFSMFIPWSHISVCGKPLIELMKEKPELFPDDFQSTMLEKVRMAGFKIANNLGTTSCGVATCSVALVKSILLDENTIFPVSTNVKGHYGIEDDVFVSVPCVVGRGGVREIIDLTLNEEERQQMDKTVGVVKQISSMTTEYLDDNENGLS